MAEKQRRKSIAMLSFFCFRSRPGAVQGMQFVVFDHRIGQKIAAKTVQSVFQVRAFAFNVDLHEFANPDALDLGHSEVPHGVADRVALRIQHSLLWFDDYVDLHSPHATANSLGNKRQALLYQLIAPRECRAPA